jgi:hypothetical protein
LDEPLDCFLIVSRERGSSSLINVASAEQLF